MPASLALRNLERRARSTTTCSWLGADERGIAQRNVAEAVAAVAGGGNRDSII